MWRTNGTNIQSADSILSLMSSGWYGLMCFSVQRYWTPQRPFNVDMIIQCLLPTFSICMKLSVWAWNPLICSSVGGWSPRVSGKCCKSSFCEASIILSFNHSVGAFSVWFMKNINCVFDPHLASCVVDLRLRQVNYISIRQLLYHLCTPEHKYLVQRVRSHHQLFSHF